MATNNNRFEIQIAATTDELKKGIQQARKELQSFQKEVNNRKLDGSYKSSMQAERLEGQKLMNQTRAVRLESAKLALEKRKTGQAVQAASGSYREAQQRLTALGRSIREAKGGFTSTSPAIKAQITEYNNLNNALKKFDAQMGNHYRNVGNYGSALSTLNPQLSMLASRGGGLLGVALAARNAYQTFSQFDSGLRNVEKTTGLTTDGVNKLGSEFVKLSRDLKVVSANSLTQYATIAGQLGVKGTRDILNFTESLAKLETATDISGENGATEIARTLTLVDGGVQNVKQFADEIVNLGNNFAATEREILSNAESIAQNVGIYKIGRQDVLAFATATKSVGIEAELVGSTFNRTLAIFERSIRTGKNLDSILSLIGGTQEELSARFKADAAGVFVDFIGALNGVNNAGGSVNEQLEAIGIRAVRDQRVIQSLAANGYDVLTDAIDKSKNAIGAAENEFDVKSKSLQSQVGRVQIAWENLVLSIENGSGSIGKAIAGITGGFADLLEVFNKIDDNNLWQSGLGMYTPTGNPLMTATGARSRSMGLAQSIWEPILGPVPAPNGRGANRNVNISSLFPNNYAYKRSEEATKEVVRSQEEISSVLIENKAYWEEEVKAIQASIDAMDVSKAGTKEWIRLTEQLSEAQKNLGLFSVSKSRSGGGRSSNTSDILGDLRASDGNFYDQKIAKINSEYDKLVSKIRESKGSGADISEALNLAGAKRDFDTLKVEVDRFLNATKKVSTGTVVPTGVISAPTTLPGLSQAQERISGLSTTANFDVELSRYLKSSLRRGVSQSLMGIFDDIGKLTQDNYAIEQKYAELRANASADQISALRKMERLEKSINNGFTNLLTNAVGAISSIGSRTLSTAIGEGVSTGDFSQLRGLFSGKNKMMGWGALGSLAGGAISGLTPKTSALGQGLGGALAGAGTGAAIGSIIPGIGTAIGAVAGAVIGGLAGIFGASRANKERELQELQLAEQRKQTALMERQNALAYSSSIIGQMTNQGIVHSVDRDATGNLVATINGSDLQLILDRSKNQRG